MAMCFVRMHTYMPRCCCSWLTLCAVGCAVLVLSIDPSCSFLALPHLQIFKLDFSDLFSKTPTVTAWSAVLAYSLVMIFDIGECCCIGP